MMKARSVWTLFLTLLAGATAAAQTTSCPPQSSTGLFWPVASNAETSPHPINGTLAELRSPLLNAGVTSVSLHDAVDIAATVNTPVFAVECGFAGPVQYPNS